MKPLASLLTCLACLPCMAADGDIVFEDTFGGPALSSAWEGNSRGWRVENGELTNSNALPGGLLVGEPAWDDYTVEVRMRTDQPGARPWSVARVLFRYQDPGNCYYLILQQGGMLELGKEQAGEHKPGLVTVRNLGEPSQWRSLRVTLEGPRILVALDQRQVIDFTDPSPLTAGQVGLDAFQGSRVRFDDLRVSGAGILQRISQEVQRVTGVLEGIGYRKSAVGNVAIFRDDNVPVHDSAPSDPEHLATLVAQLGAEATFLDATQMADPAVLSPDSFQVVILPYGSAFPREAAQAFKQFLRRRGSFLSTGGYFADNLYNVRDTQEMPALLSNGGFDQGLGSWQPSEPTPGFTLASVADPVRSGAGALEISVSEDAKIDFHSAVQRLETLKPGQELLLNAWVRTRGLRGGVGAYVAFNFFRENGERISWSQSNPVTNAADWVPLQIRATVPAQTAYITVNLLLHGHGRAWFDDAQLTDDSGAAHCLNTREGDIKGPGNSLRVKPDQIGVFDPSYTLEQVTSLRTSPGQPVTSAPVDLTLDATGYSASGMFIGNGQPITAITHARPIYLLDVFDRSGRLRGRAGAIIRNHLGFYTGSDWAVFGVTNHDLFPPGDPHSARLFTDTLRVLLDKTYLAEVHPEFACYRQGESVKLEALVANFTPAPRTVQVRFSVQPGRASGPAVFLSESTVTLQPGATTPVVDTWIPDGFAADFYTLSAELIVDGKSTDRHENAFVVWNEDELRKAPRLSARHSYLARDGETAFLCGTGDAGYPYYAESETPLVWDDQLRLMRDMGLRYYRCMHFFSAYPGKPLETLDDLPPAQLRRLDALVYLTHKHGLGFLFVNNVDLQLSRDNEPELAGRKTALRLLAQRYANAGGFMFNMDHQEFISKGNARADAAFQAFLSRKYPSYADLARAWGLPAEGGFDQIRFDDAAANADPWGSARGLDTGEFLCSYRDAWRGNAAGAIHEGSPAALYWQDSSMYWWPDFAWPASDVSARISATSTHFYGDAARFPFQVKRGDMQVMGKPLGQTEFGILTHPAWTGHRDCRLSHDDADQFILMTSHYCLGVGASMMSNWNWKENKECIFPWAVAHHDLVPKEHLRAYRNAALLLAGIRPRYEFPQVFVVVPNAHLRTNRAGQVDAAIRDCVSRLMAARVRFSLIGEEYLDHLPNSARALLYPVPFCPDDQTVARLAAFVESGGCLYFSGDITFDPSCKRTRTRRLETLAGCGFVAENFPHLSVSAETRDQPCIRVEPISARVLMDSPNGPRLLHHRRGAGHVLFAAEPLEARASNLALAQEQIAHLGLTQSAADPYQLILALAGVDRIPLSPADSPLHSFQLATRDGGTVYTLFNTGDAPVEATLTHAGRQLKLTLAPQRPALAHFNEQGALIAVESQDEASLDGQLLWFGAGHFILISLDGADLGGQPSSLAVMAVGTGQANIPCAASITGAVLQHGELRGLNWRALSTEVPGAAVRVNASGDTRSTVALISASARQDDCARLLEDLARR